MLIGVSGKSGSGKSSVAKYLANKLGATLIDLDVWSKEIRDNYPEKILEIVKDSSILVEGKIDSKRLGNVLFGNSNLMKDYNLFIYEELRKRLDSELKKDRIYVLDSIFLPIMEIFNNCEYKILVVCDDLVRKERIIKRDHISEEYFNRRESFKIVYNEKDYDYVIDNENNYQSQVNEIIKSMGLKS